MYKATHSTDKSAAHHHLPAAVMAHIRKREKELGITPDPQLDALTQQAQLGKEGTSVMVYLM